MKPLPMALVRACVVLALVPAAMPAKGSRNVSLTPDNGKSTIVLIDGKEREYFMLTSGATLKFQVDGPGKLTVMSRLVMPDGRAEAEGYAIRILEGGNSLKLQTTQTDRSDASIKGSGEVL